VGRDRQEVAMPHEAFVAEHRATPQCATDSSSRLYFGSIVEFHVLQQTLHLLSGHAFREIRRGITNAGIVTAWQAVR